MTFEQLTAFVAHALTSRSYELGFVAMAVAFEVLVRSRLALRLVPNGYLLDLTYCLIYRLGFYSLLIDRPTLEPIFAQITWDPILALPMWMRVIAYILTLDFANYWIHRIEHAVPALWAFHQVHHSQDQLSIMTTYRNHPVDIWLRHLIGPAIAMMVFGLHPALWLWLSILWDVTINLSHLEVNWTYGPFRWLLVSPVSHAIHHSVEDRHQNRNYGANLAIWDRMFGTADTGTLRPVAVGLPGWQVRDSLPAQLWAPVRGILRHYRGLPMDELAPLTRESAPPASSASEKALRT